MRKTIELIKSLYLEHGIIASMPLHEEILIYRGDLIVEAYDYKSILYYITICDDYLELKSHTDRCLIKNIKYADPTLVQNILEFDALIRKHRKEENEEFNKIILSSSILFEDPMEKCGIDLCHDWKLIYRDNLTNTNNWKCQKCSKCVQTTGTPKYTTNHDLK